jgi:hypothetical protein
MNVRARKGRWYHFLGAGCAGALLLIVVALTLLVLFARSQAGPEEVVTRNLERELPTPAASEGAGPRPAGHEGQPAAAIHTEGARLPSLVAPPSGTEGPSAGRVTLELSQGEFHVRPAAVGEPLHVEARYDLSTYELVDELDEGKAEAGGWTYQVRFRQKRELGLLQALRRMFGGQAARVTVYLPRDVPMDLALRVSQGGGEVELGGLWLTQTDVSFSQGGGDLAFSEPLREPTESLTIDASMGGGSFRKLGNASPRRLKVQSQMGGGDLDFSGEWLRDCEVSIESRMGGMQVRLPHDVGLRGLSRWGKDREAEGPAGGRRPVLTFSISSEMGEVDVSG